MLERNKDNTKHLLYLNRPTQEFVGGMLYLIGFAGLATLAGVLPLIVIRSTTVVVIVIEFLALISIGGVMFMSALRRDGISWMGTVGIAAIIAALCSILIYVPLWFLTAIERALL